MALAVRRTQAASAAKEPNTGDQEREFSFSEADFRGFVELAYEHAGIALADSKRNLVYSRLSRRLRALGMNSFREYREYLSSSEGSREIVEFINAISTNLTKFFREVSSFRAFKFARRCDVRARIAVPVSGCRIWSAGCSTGEEPYTIAVVLKREIRDIERHDVRILATDIDTDVLAKAACGEYPDGCDRRRSQNVPGVLSGRAGRQRRSPDRFRRYHQGAHHLPAPQLDAAVAVSRHVRRNLLPQRHDLFRRTDQRRSLSIASPNNFTRAAGSMSVIRNR